MLRPAKQLLKRVLKERGLAVAGIDLLQGMRRDSATLRNIEWVSRLPGSEAGDLLRACQNSKAQLGQDLFVLTELGFKRGGFFVEFGAASGIDLSNTYLLEQEFDWRGVLAEPGKRWHAALLRNRRCPIETDCVWRETGAKVVFNEVEEGEYSAIDAYSSLDLHSARREHGTKYDVDTISLEDLLDKYHAPRIVDYLSIDTEGSEFDILKAFNFDKYSFRIITCEHNFEPQRERIEALLAEHNYMKKYPELSQYDDWYVKSDPE